LEAGPTLGQIDLNISKSTGAVERIDWKVIPVTDKTKDDPQFAALNRKYGALLKELSQVVGRTAVDLDARSAVGRTMETNVGDFIADAFRAATGADVGLTNGGSIRADEIIRAGPVAERCARCWSTAWIAARKMPSRAAFRKYPG
jgi:5'-nucleotidase